MCHLEPARFAVANDRCCKVGDVVHRPQESVWLFSNDFRRTMNDMKKLSNCCVLLFHNEQLPNMYVLLIKDDGINSGS